MDTFESDPGEAASFAIDLVSTFASVVLVGFAFALCRPFTKFSGNGTTAYGWRWALILFVLTCLLSTLLHGLPNSIILTPYFNIVGIFLSALSAAVDCMIVYSIARLCSHPLRTAGLYVRDPLPWILLGIQAFLAVAITAATIALDATTIQYELIEPGEFEVAPAYVLVSRITNVIFVLCSAVSFLISIVLLVVAVRSTSKCSAAKLNPEARRAPFFMIIAATLWIVCQLGELVIQAIYSTYSFNPEYWNSVNGPVIQALAEVIADFPVVGIFIVLVILFNKASTQSYVYAGQPHYDPSVPQQSYPQHAPMYPPAAEPSHFHRDGELYYPHGPMHPPHHVSSGPYGMPYMHHQHMQPMGYYPQYPPDLMPKLHGLPIHLHSTDNATTTTGSSPPPTQWGPNEPVELPSPQSTVQELPSPDTFGHNRISIDMAAGVAPATRPVRDNSFRTQEGDRQTPAAPKAKHASTEFDYQRPDNAMGEMTASWGR